MSEALGGGSLTMLAMLETSAPAGLAPAADAAAGADSAFPLSAFSDEQEYTDTHRARLGTGARAIIYIICDLGVEINLLGTQEAVQCRGSALIPLQGGVL